MPTLADPDFNVKVLKEKNRIESAQTLTQDQRWSLRCLHLECTWTEDGLPSPEAATAAAQGHADSTGHPVKRHAVIEFDCGIVRSRSAIERR